MKLAREDFGWDEAKNRTNRRKHGIDFEDVVAAFNRPYIEDFDLRHSGGEDRWRVLGLVSGAVAVIAYTMRDGKRRLISARRATREETLLYYDTFFGEPF